MSNLPKHAETLHIRLRTADREVITTRATRAGLTVSEYARRAMLGTLEPAIGRPSVIQPRPGEYVDEPPTIPKGPNSRWFISSAEGDDPA